MSASFSLRRGGRALATLSVLTPCALLAQTARTPKATVAGRPLAGACAALSGTPSDLVRSPEGMAVLRLKRELDGAATVFVQKGMPGEAADAKHMLEMQRGVDSLMQIIVRTRGADGVGDRTIVLRRGDSTTTLHERMIEGKPIEGRLPFESMDGTNKGIEVFVRSIEPKVKEFAAATARAGGKAFATGYLGVNMSGSQIRSVSDSGAFTAHCDYPVIESVELGSPARAAGLEAGDTIVAYNGRDVVAQVVNYPQLLVPGKVIKVRVRREGKPREVAVTVAERPRDTATESFTFRLPPPMPSSVMTPRMIAANASAGFVLGAQLNAIDDDFAQTLGLEPGLLVMRVQVGSPVADAGVRAGEVIRAVNGTISRELNVLQRAALAPGVHELKLTITARAATPRTVVVKF